MRFKEFQIKEDHSSKSAVVTYGSFMGHTGHQKLVDKILEIAKDDHRDPFVYISPMVGTDDPVPPELKLETFQLIYPEIKNIFRIVGSGPDKEGVIRSGGIRGAIKFDLVPAGYTDILLVMGSDQENSFKYLTTDRARQSIGAKVSIVTRQQMGSTDEGIRSTTLRNIIKSNSPPYDTYEGKLDGWIAGFSKKLPPAFVEKLMNVAAENMGIDLDDSKITEKMLPKSAFCGTERGYKLGAAGQLK